MDKINERESRASFRSGSSHEEALKAISKRNKKWRCLYPECCEKSIFSHAISKSISLTCIAEDQHLTIVNSRRINNLKEFEFKKISIHDASGFNGFCLKHDATFSLLDTKKICDSRSLILQAYRSVISLSSTESRVADLRYAHFDFEELESSAFKYAKEHPSIPSDLLRDHIVSEYKKIIAATNLRAISVMKLANDLIGKIVIIENHAFGSFDFDTVTTEKLSHSVLFRYLDFKVPVAINSIFPTIVSGNERDFFFTVIPYEDSTLMMAVVPKDCPKWLNERILKSFATEAMAINFIESILSCSNDWYMTPSVLRELPEEKQRIFLEDSMFTNERHFWETYDMTLLDTLRETLALKYPKDEENFRAKERKILPIREIYDVRHKRMMDKIFAELSGATIK